LPDRISSHARDYSGNGNNREISKSFCHR
jgi:hypothetical protein